MGLIGKEQRSRLKTDKEVRMADAKMRAMGQPKEVKPPSIVQGRLGTSLLSEETFVSPFGSRIGPG